MSFAHTFVSVVIITVLVTSAAKGGDGNPFLPKQISIEFTSPFLKQPEYSYKKATVVILFGADKKGITQWEMRYACPASIDIQLGRERLSVPAKIVNDIRRPNVSEMSFLWFADQYVLSFSAQLRGNQFGTLRFFWRDSALVAGGDLKTR